VGRRGAVPGGVTLRGSIAAGAGLSQPPTGGLGGGRSRRARHRDLAADLLRFGLFLAGVGSITVGVGLFSFRREATTWADAEPFLA